MAFLKSNGSVTSTLGKYTGIGKLGPRLDLAKLMKIGKEENLMENKISTCPVEYAQAEENEKTAAWGTLGQNFMKGVASTAGLMLTGAALSGIGNAIGNIMDRRKYENNLKLAIQLAPSLQRYPFEMLKSYLPMIVKASPTVASDPRLLANYMESMLDAEGHLNLATFRELSSLEGNVLQNQTLANPVRTELIKGLSKGVGESFGGAFKNMNN